MKKLFACLAVIVVLGAVVGGSAYWWSTHYIVKTQPGVIVLDKRFITVKNTVHDVRDWGSEEFDKHEHLKKALKEQGYGDIIRKKRKKELTSTVREKAETLKDEAEDLGDAVRKKVGKWLDGNEKDADAEKRKESGGASPEATEEDVEEEP